MAGAAQAKGPSSVDEGLNNVLQALTAAMTAPDAMDPKNHDPLMKLFQATLGAKAQIAGKGAGGGQPGGAPPGGAPPGGAPGGMMQGGGTNLRQLGGGAPMPPSAGMGGGPSSTGMSAEDLRDAVAAQAAS